MLQPGCEPRCPGCAHRHLTATASQQQKYDWLATRLAPWHDSLQPLQSVPATQRWNYHDKLCLSVRWQNNHWNFGLWRGDELIPIPDCPVHSARARAVIQLLSTILPASDNFPLAYYVQAGRQITLIVKAKSVATDWFDENARQQLAKLDIDGFWLHCHPSAGHVLFHKNGWHLLWGTPRSKDTFGLSYGPSAFQQLLPVLYARSLAQAARYLDPQPGDLVLDLYCGYGVSLNRWLACGAQAIGVELSGEAVDCARDNAPQARLLRGKCSQRLPQLQVLTAPYDRRLLYVNPPRTGLEPAVLEWLCRSYQARRIAYLSCSAGTLRRDLETLCDHGYRVQHITPYDFFPQTYHVETLVLCERDPH